MNEYENANRNRRALAGLALVSLGSLLMLGKLGLLAVQVPGFLASLAIDIYGIRGAIGIALLRLFQTIAFHPAAIVSFAGAILVLFSAFVAIVVGLTLLRKRVVETA